MRRGESLPRAFQAPVDVHASVDGQVYMFHGRQADSGGSSEDDEFNVMELRPRGRDSEERERERVGELLLLERDISQGDNLNKLALQYGCKVADIKRVNNLIQDQDLYALKSIKIPVKKHSILTETNSELREPEPEPSTQSTASAVSCETPTEGSPGRPQVQEYTDFLKEVDNDIERLIQTTEEEFLVDQEGPRRWGPRGQRLGSYGADWGIQWWNAVVAMLLIGIVLPIFYVVYFKTQDSGTAVLDDSGVNSSSSITTSNSSIASVSMLSPESTVMDHLSKPHT
ncbi:lysM and putative peptidoglycan-binding domain-containing protein 4 [Alosa sapidissima]|uniref:lysM and putative peptidoglycan-binding domain-containing protein 4 n=1 Tax=Alosa sapidissima TaxID=34773 RepID=UPI001C084CFA|nr:lysM and putative peptidoglycan-binding domain-containing protein 4 [Alosa sapidissima]XP_041967169.1 lysM and putative peptidoglycan-binding domain-containing protein 4 [Alosa sapidissima]